MTTIHGAVNVDKVHASAHGNILSIHDASNDHDNGTVCFAGDLVSGQRELFAFAQADANNITQKPLVFIATGELTYLAGQTVLDFYNKAGSAMRGFVLVEGDVMTVTNNMLVGTPAVDNWLAPVAGSNLLNVETSMPSTKFVARVIDINASIAGQAATTFIVEHA